MRKLLRAAFTRPGQSSDAWPVLLLLFAVVVPALCLLWFMNAAMRNERLATRQKLTDVYRAQLSSAQRQLERSWDAMLAEIEVVARVTPPSLAFATCVASGLVDSVLLFDERGRMIYPNAPLPVPATESGPRWDEASQLEYLRKDLAGAAKRYHALAGEATNVHVAARARQAEARCLARAGQTNDAIRLITETFGDQRYRFAADPQGRLISANAELMALELGAGHAVAQRLKGRLMDYRNPVLAAPQRRFLMKEMRRRFPEMDFPTLAAEELAAQTPTNVWQLATSDGRAVALLRPRLQHAGITLLAPGAENTAFVSLPAGPRLPGWHLGVPDLAAPSPTNLYLFTALLVLGAMGVLTLLAVRVLRRQVALARLKNDLVATVSHELKTPLSSMRVLVETLLNAERLEEPRTREYLQLISRENDRLSRLVQNFLTFSRLERNKRPFNFRLTAVRPMIDGAVAAMPFEVIVDAPSDLPGIMADPDAVTTVLVNLLDNACKYSESGKPIVLRACARNGGVDLSVQDHGIGIAPREARRIFKPFYQVDQRLSHDGGGCGLGLSIVQSIVAAHGGNVSVESRPERGSTFTISLPAAKHA